MQVGGGHVFVNFVAAQGARVMHGGIELRRGNDGAHAFSQPWILWSAQQPLAAGHHGGDGGPCRGEILQALALVVAAQRDDQRCVVGNAVAVAHTGAQLGAARMDVIQRGGRGQQLDGPHLDAGEVRAFLDEDARQRVAQRAHDVDAGQ